jgi:uncharacterized protein YdaU (DUF1376 family)
MLARDGNQEPQRPYPYFNFFVGDVAKRTMDMNATEFGAYMLLVMFYWEHGRLPAEEDAPLVTRLDRKAWRRVSKKVLERASYEIPFLEDEKRRIADNIARGRKGAEARWRKRDAMPAQCLGNA